MPTVEEVLKRRWITAGGGRLWNTQGTYSAVAYDRLPLLPASASSLDLLSMLPARDYGCTLDGSSNHLGKFADLDATLQSLGFAFPGDFAEFIARSDLQARVPSCTACYLALSDAATPLPGYPDHYVVRFLNDSQACILWYLLFQPSLPTRVIASSRFIERDIFDAMHYEQDAGEPSNYEAVLSAACICADSFTEFIGRFCIENTLWFALHENWPLTPVELSYWQTANPGT